MTISDPKRRRHATARQGSVSTRLLSAIAIALAGCAQARDLDAEVGAESEQQLLTILDVDRELALGDDGADVRAVHEHMRAYGYFPNASLKATYSHWTPIVPDEPEDEEQFGPELEEAVTAMQRFMGLDVTGRIDRVTLGVMQGARCGYPESALDVALPDPTEKWAPFISDANGIPFRWTNPAIRFKITQPSSPTAAQTTALTSALATLNAQSFLNLTVTTGASFEVEVKFWARGSNPAGWTDFFSSSTTAQVFQSAPPSGVFNRIGMNTAQANFSTFDLQSVFVHEVGHIVGLGHSSVRNNPGPCVGSDSTTQSITTCPVMWPLLANNTQRRTLNRDDRASLGLLYNLWNSKPGFALDVGAGGTAATPRIDATSSSNSLFFFKNNTWNQVAANAVAIAVDDAGLPWAVSSDGTIWQGSTADPTLAGFAWQARSNGSLANDIAASNGQVWIISRTAAAGFPGNFLVMQRSGGAWSSANNGIGKRIAVDWGGRPWVLHNNGSVWRRYGTGDTINQTGGASPTWQAEPVESAGAGAVGLRDRHRRRQRSQRLRGRLHCGLRHNLALWIWDEQPTLTNTIQQGQFIPMDGFGVRITASPDGRPWVSQANGAVFRRSINLTQQ